MDVKYSPSDWEKMRNGIGDLIGKGRLGKGMIDVLKDVSDNLEEAEASIAKYDSDGVITFHHANQKSKYQDLDEDFEVLYRFTGKVGGIVDRTIDQPFYDDMDAFVEAMRDLSIKNYTTKNRLGITETVYATDGLYNSTEVEKAEVSLEDLFRGDQFYAKQLNQEYQEWKKLNPDQNFSGKEYKQAALSGRAFEYESIRDQQENKESLVQTGLLGATIISAGITLLCPPAGLVLLTAIGAASGAMEVKSAVTGKDWVSGRELGTGERALRGTFGALDLVPGAGSITKFSSSVRTLSLGKNMGTLGLKSGFKAGFRQEVTHTGGMAKEAGKISASRLKSAEVAIKDGSNVMKNNLVKGTLEAGKVVDTGITFVKDSIPFGKRVVMTSTDEKVYMSAENTHAVENKLIDKFSRIKGVNLEGGIHKGTNDLFTAPLKNAEKTIEDLPNQIDNLSLRETPDAGRVLKSAVPEEKNILQERKLGIAAGDEGLGNDINWVGKANDGVYKSIQRLVSESTCNKDELYNYLLENVDSDSANAFFREGKWPEGIQIPKNSSVLNADGSINWSKAAEGGYTLNTDGMAIKQDFVPKIGEVIDRYGNANGRYTSPVINRKSFSYTERSLPYVEDLSNYHQYEVMGDFTKIKEYVDKCTDIKLKTKIETTVRKYYKGDYSRLVSYKGNAAAVKGWGKGGAIQYEFSLTVEQLEGLGLLKEIK